MDFATPLTYPILLKILSTTTSVFSPNPPCFLPFFLIRTHFKTYEATTTVVNLTWFYVH